MLKQQIYDYINDSIDRTFIDIKKMNHMLDTMLNELIKNIIKFIKKDELKLFDTIIKNVELYCRYYNINDINTSRNLNIKQWIDLIILGDIILVINLLYLNMISDKFIFKMVTNIPLDGNNYLFLFKILTQIAGKHNKLVCDLCLEYQTQLDMDNDFMKILNNNLDRFIVGLNDNGINKIIINEYIRSQIDTLKKYNNHITNIIISVLDKTENKMNAGLQAEIMNNNLIWADQLIKIL